MKASKTLLRALEIINTIDIPSPSGFAHLMWPQSSAWKRDRGRSMARSAGGYLGRLEKAGLIKSSWRLWPYKRREWRLTDTGKQILNLGKRDL